MGPVLSFYVQYLDPGSLVHHPGKSFDQYEWPVNPSLIHSVIGCLWAALLTLIPPQSLLPPSAQGVFQRCSTEHRNTDKTPLSLRKSKASAALSHSAQDSRRTAALPISDRCDRSPVQNTAKTGHKSSNQNEAGEMLTKHQADHQQIGQDYDEK